VSRDTANERTKVIDIPVVVHILMKDDGSSDASLVDIERQIVIMNEGFSGKESAEGSSAAGQHSDTYIRFHLHEVGCLICFHFRNESEIVYA
jgi:hypothetical protein